MKALVDLLRTDAMDRILERALERAEEALPDHEASAANPRLVYRDHYAAQAEQCREEIAAINAITAALAALDAETGVVPALERRTEICARAIRQRDEARARIVIVRKAARLEGITAGFLAGINHAKKHAEISTWDGWHEHSPRVDWTLVEMHKAAALRAARGES